MTACVNYYRSFSTELAERPYSRTVVIAVDASQHSENAFQWYMKSIHRPMNRILLLHIPEGHDIEMEKGITLSEEQVKEFVESDNKSAHDMIAKYQQKLEKSGANATYRIVIGKPGEVIVDEAKREDASLIVLGTRGMGLIRRTILGSVSDYVVQHAVAPVLVFRS